MDLLRARLARAAVRRRQVCIHIGISQDEFGDESIFAQGGQGSREDLWGGMERAQLVNIG